MQFIHAFNMQLLIKPLAIEIMQEQHPNAGMQPYISLTNGISYILLETILNNMGCMRIEGY